MLRFFSEMFFLKRFERQEVGGVFQGSRWFFFRFGIVRSFEFSRGVVQRYGLYVWLIVGVCKLCFFFLISLVLSFSFQGGSRGRGRRWVKQLFVFRMIYVALVVVELNFFLEGLVVFGGWGLKQFGKNTYFSKLIGEVEIFQGNKVI